jgi:hypothetical protein
VLEIGLTALLPGAQPYVAPILLMPVVLGAAITVTMLMHVATKWAFYGRGTQAQYRKYSWSFQARGRGLAPVLTRRRRCRSGWQRRALLYSACKRCTCPGSANAACAPAAACMAQHKPWAAATALLPTPRACVPRRFRSMPGI